MAKIIIDLKKIPTNCYDCELLYLVSNCPCAIGLASTYDYRDCKHNDCPIKTVLPDNAINGDVMEKVYGEQMAE